MLKKNKIRKIQRKNFERKKLIQKPQINCNLKIQIKIKDLILEDKGCLLKNLEKNYGLSVESQRSQSQQFNRTVVNKGPVCHSKSKESYTITQTLDYMNFFNQNLAQSLKFFIETEKLFLKKGSTKFKLSMNI